MDQVRIGEKQITTTRLGYGCSALVGGHTRKEALRLLETAFDCGIRHFDVARVYGTGDAERILGEFAALRRSEVTITTKFGFVPLPPTRAVEAAKRVVRLASRRSSTVLRMVRKHASATATRPEFNASLARTSLEASLAALRTDYVDFYLLHDCMAGDWQAGEMLVDLGQAVERGLVRTTGTATSYEQTRALLAADGPDPDVVQFEDHAGLGNALTVGGRTYGEPRAITYGPFWPLSTVRTYLRDPDRMSEWRRRLDLDVARDELLATLLLAGAMRANPGGVVLFSSGDATRIATNARAGGEPRFAPAQLEETARLVRAAIE